MEGVRILAENAIMLTQYSFVWNGWFIFCYIIAGLFAILTIVLMIDDDIAYVLTITVTAFMFIIGTSIGNDRGTEEVYDYTEYKVIVNDTVNMSEFMKKYEILDIDGEIYVVRERVENE